MLRSEYLRLDLDAHRIGLRREGMPIADDQTWSEVQRLLTTSASKIVRANDQTVKI
jgi:hypothetical protein